jgi:hypothetical protein
MDRKAVKPDESVIETLITIPFLCAFWFLRRPSPWIRLVFFVFAFEFIESVAWFFTRCGINVQSLLQLMFSSLLPIT